MIVLCSPTSETDEVGFYHVEKVNKDFYQATLKKFTGNKNNFPGVVLLWRQPEDWVSFPEGHRSLVGCIVQELEKWI